MQPDDLDENEVIYMADIPGTEDTKGNEVDLANMISLLKLTEVCESITLACMWSIKSHG